MISISHEKDSFVFVKNDFQKLLNIVFDSWNWKEQSYTDFSTRACSILEMREKVWLLSVLSSHKLKVLTYNLTHILSDQDKFQPIYGVRFN